MKNKTMKKSVLDKIGVKKAVTSYEVPEFTLGGDPEIYISDAAGEIKSSIPILKQDKYNPIILDEEKQIKLYSDSSLAELAFAPSKTKKDFVDTFRIAFQKTQKHLGNKYRLCIKSAHHFKKEELKEEHGINPNLVGCGAEFSFWEKKVNELGEFTNSMRSGSSHIHVGAEFFEPMENKENALKMIEVFLGCASIIWDNDETSIERRKKYGTSGAFRPTAYGFETRFMSNYMLNSPELVELAYDLIQYSLSHAFNNTFEQVLASIDIKDVQTSINKCNKQLAEKVLTQAKLPKELFDRVMLQSKKSYSTSDFYTNWQIKV